jgi:prepilin-type N-terminal cleavage/methylation domain-containing protein
MKDDPLKRIKALRRQGGFTLLELLVVVAILAAIAGTAAIALQDTDARASAAAHVAMMDELNKGIHTYRVLNKNEFPNHFDALLGTTGQDAANGEFPPNDLIGYDAFGIITLDNATAPLLNDIGIRQLQYLDYDAGADLNEDGTDTDCARANVVDTIDSRSNAVVGGNIFMTPGANGCGVALPVEDGAKVLVWTGGYERVLGAEGVAYDDATPDFDPSALDAGSATGDSRELTAAPAGAPVFMVVGTGPSSTLFNANELGGMTTVPIYRHVGELQYQRYFALFNIGTFTGTGVDYTPTDQVTFVGIIDGAGDTKEEELGEWDGTRNTI